jgi:hypothetical protein
MNVITEIRAEAQIEFGNLSVGSLFKYPTADTIFMKIVLKHGASSSIHLQTGEEKHINMETRVILVPKIILECC